MGLFGVHGLTPKGESGLSWLSDDLVKRGWGCDCGLCSKIGRATGPDASAAHLREVGRAAGHVQPCAHSWREAVLACATCCGFGSAGCFRGNSSGSNVQVNGNSFRQCIVHVSSASSALVGNGNWAQSAVAAVIAALA